MSGRAKLEQLRAAHTRMDCGEAEPSKGTEPLACTCRGPLPATLRPARCARCGGDIAAAVAALRTSLSEVEAERDHERHEKETVADLAAIQHRRMLAATAREKALETALRDVLALEREPFDFPTDWEEQIRACAECHRWKGHPIQGGICDEHRRPLYARERRNEDEQKRLIYRAKDIARAALASGQEEGQP